MPPLPAKLKTVAAVESVRLAPGLTVMRPVPAAAALPRVTVPAPIVMPPVKVFAPESVTLPRPSALFTEPPPVPMTPETTMFPSPPKTVVKAPPSAPESVSVPASELMRVAPVRVSGPAKVLAPETLRRAPELLMPPPPRVSGSANVVIPPWISRAAPEVIVVFPATVPRAPAEAILRTPAVMLVVPT